MIQKTLALSMLLMLAPVASVSAAQLNDEFNISLQVEASCDFKMVGDILIDLRGIAEDVRSTDPSLSNWMLRGVSQETQALVTCNEGLPYTLEVDAGPNGAITLTDAGTGKSVPMQMRLGDDATRWGTVANGEHISGIGDGQRQDIELFVGYSWGYTIPVGTYTTVQVATLNF